MNKSPTANVGADGAKHRKMSQAEVVRRSAALHLAPGFLKLVIEHIPARVAVKEARELRFVLHNRAVEELTLHVRSLARQLFGDERAALQVAFSGGMLSRGSAIRKRLEHRLKSAVPGATVRAEPVIPARGAVRAALRIVGEAMV